MIDQVLEQCSVEDRLDFELLAGDRRPDHREDARTDHCADAEGGQAQPAERLSESLLRSVCIGNKLVDALGTEKLWIQSPPSAPD